MPPMLLFLSISMPLLMTAAAIATIHRMREHERRQDEAEKWRDTSLDDWRQERDAQLQAEREQRVVERADALAAGREEEEAEPVRQQRIGG